MHSAEPDVSSLLERLSAIDASSLADAGKGVIRVLPAQLRPVRRGLRMLGRAVTVDAREDLMPMLAGLAAAGPGDVLVAMGNDRHAVAGELFASEAQRRGLTGIVIDGLCRDTGTLATMEFPVYARGAVPSACPARAVPIVQVPITIGSVTVNPGDVVLGDDDGVVVGSVAEIEGVLETAETIQRREEALRDAIVAGSSLFDHLNYAEYLQALQTGGKGTLIFS